MADSTAKAQTWGYTLNNHTEQEMVLIRDPPASVEIVHHVWTPEQGESGTPHIQGYIKLRKQVRKSHLIKRWLARASYRPLNDTEYRANMLAYVQKQDSTARAPTTQSSNTTPMLYPSMIPQLIMEWIHDNTEEHMDEQWNTPGWRRWIRNAPPSTETFAEWLDRQTDRHDGYDRVRHPHEVEHRWFKQEFMPTHEAPLPLLIEYAKSQLVRRYQCETLVNKPDVVGALNKYAREILARIEHNHAVQASIRQEEDDEAEEAVVPPTEGTDATQRA